MGLWHSALRDNDVSADSLNFVGRDGKVYANGQPFSIKGVNCPRLSITPLSAAINQPSSIVECVLVC